MRSWLAPLLAASALALGACDSASGTGESSEGTSPVPAQVTWIDVIASDYTLELVPGFDREVTEYQALARGPGIAVWTDVIVNADVDVVRVNGVDAQLAGFRLWRSAPETGLLSPASATIEVVNEGALAQTFTIEIVLE